MIQALNQKNGSPYHKSAFVLPQNTPSLKRYLFRWAYYYIQCCYTIRKIAI